MVSAVIGYAAAMLWKGSQGSQKLEEAEREAGKIVVVAKEKAERLLKEAAIEAKDLLLKMKSDFESRGEGDAIRI